MHDHPGPTGASVDPIERLDREWEALAAGPLRAALTHWARDEPRLRAFAAPAVLLRFLRGPGDAGAKDDLLRALLRCARSDTLAGRVVLQALIPGLKAQVGRQLFAADERDLLWEATFANCWERICCYPLEQRPRRIAANILLDTLHATSGERKHERDAHRELAANESLPAADPRGADVEAPLRRAVAAGVISDADAELILVTRIDGRSVVDLAAEMNLGYQALLMRRIRAEARLGEYLANPTVSLRGRNRPFSRARASGAEQ